MTRILTPEQKERKRAYMKARYQAKKDDILAKDKLYREANKEKIAAREKMRYESRREEFRLKSKARYQAKHEERLAYAKVYREANPDKVLESNRRLYKKRYAEKSADILEKQKKYRQNNLESVREYERKSYAKNKKAKQTYQINNAERRKELHAIWRKANPERVRMSHLRRRARLAGNEGSYTIDEINEKFAALGNCCFYCGKGGKMTIDHDVPVSRGGSNYIENLLPACKPCNSKKSAMTSQEYFASLEITNHTKTGGIESEKSR